jgi:peptide/nickel transport system substrate-binding protein
MGHLGGTLRRGLLSLLAVSLVLWGAPAIAQTVRAVMHAEVKHLDPHWTTANITQAHSYMIYETLFALDSKGVPQPQMVDKYTVSPDKLTYTFTLRNGLKWHDGKPVRSADAVASIKRWAIKDAAGQKLIAKTASLAVTDDRTFVLKLKEPYGLVLRSLAKEYSYVPFIIPERHAVQTANNAFEGEKIGSGPFVFAEKEWVPGAKTVYLRNKDYVPRAEPSDYYAGARKATVERVEWVVIPDQSTAVAALEKGEVDYIERPHSDQLPILRKISSVTVQKVEVQQMQIHPNHLNPPFDQPKARQALALMVDQKDYMRAIAGDPENWRECWAFLGCGQWLDTDAGSESLRKQDLARAKQLLTEAGYKGEKIVVMAPSDIPSINAASLSTVAMLRKLGVTVDLQVMDWGTLTSRRPVKDAPSKNPAGWHIFHTTSNGVALWDPWGHSNISTRCAEAWFGWPCSERATKALDDLGNAAAGTPEFKRLLTEYHTALMENLPYIPVGEFNNNSAWRKDRLEYRGATPYTAFWNMTRK